MRLYRDDCTTALHRLDGWTCVFAQICSLNPLELFDETGYLHLTNVLEGVLNGHVEIGDHCYALLDITIRPIRCVRITVVPEEIAPFAMFQLQAARELEVREQEEELGFNFDFGRGP